MKEGGWFENELNENIVCGTLFDKMANHQLVRAIFSNLLLCLTINFIFWPITEAIHSFFAVQMDGVSFFDKKECG